MDRGEWKWPLGVLGFVMAAAIFVHYQPHKSGDVASWVQAVGSIGAIVSGFAVANVQQRNAERRLRLDEEMQSEKLRTVGAIMAEKIRDTALELVIVAAGIDRQFLCGSLRRAHSTPAR